MAAAALTSLLLLVLLGWALLRGRPQLLAASDAAHTRPADTADAAHAAPAPATPAFGARPTPVDAHAAPDYAANATPSSAHAAGCAAPFETACLVPDLDGAIATAKATLKIYVYSNLTAGWRHGFEDVDCERVHQGGNYMYLAESLVPRMLAASGVEVVADPARANAFLVVHNATCYTHHQARTMAGTMDFSMSGAHVAAVYLEPLLRTVREAHPFYNASQGADHVYVFVQDHATRVSQHVRNVTQTGVRVQYFGAHAAYALHTTNASASTIYQPDRDIVIPQLTSLRPTTDPLVHAATRASQRPYLATFIGSIRPQHVYSRGVRQDLLRLYGNDSALHRPARQIRVTQGHVKQNYSAALTESTFGLCPGGWAPWSPRLFDTMSQGAIPVIQSDYIVEPFEAYFDWRKLSVRLLNNRTAELRDILLAVRADAAALDCKQATIRAVAPYFFWSQCSPGACKPADLLVLALCENLGLCAPARREAPFSGAEWR